MGLEHLLQKLSPNRPLGGRYKIISRLGVGGFGQTFLAEDLHLPGQPQCVVKQFKPQTTDVESLKTARRLFDTEANVLYQLGNHDQIPRLLAHFEDNQEFYLVQELIEGKLLNQEIEAGKPWAEAQVIDLLKEILSVLTFVHQQNVIHRDIKPSNLMRRDRDSRIVLIDFGAVKQASTPFANSTANPTMTISIGTQGYMPKEQLGGSPRFSSDIYAVGMIGIQVLTGLRPQRLDEDPVTSEITWHDLAPTVSPELAAILDQMVRYDFRARYATAAAALEALQTLPVTPEASSLPLATAEIPVEAIAQPPNLKAQSSASSAKSTSESQIPAQQTLQLPGQPQQPETGTGATLPLRRSPSQKSSNSLSSSVSAIAVSVLMRIQALKPIPVLAIILAVGTTFFVAKAFSPSQMSDRPVANGEAVQSNSPNQPERADVRPPTQTSNPKAQTDRQKNPEKNLSKNSPADAQPPGNSPGSTAKPIATPAPDTEAQATELLHQADQLRQAKRYQKAVVAYDQAIASQSNDASAYWGRCYSLNALKQPDAALAACDKAISLQPNYPEALWSKGFALDQQKRHQEALALYDKAIALKPDFAEAWSNRGTSLLLLDRPSEAVVAFDKAIALKSNFAEAWNNRAAALWKLQRFEEAITSVEKALQIQPDYNHALSLRQQMRQRLGR
ncbi:tetratricopeptide repeat protein [Kovacikia minuta CCNUW1]|uniref:serine/threonine-protein kinase n=1 Tax=Kovacikia minuta TaxID=2931930 RepID=UPI001CCE6E27|nr:serine/threonine-protein kinase [Kovacikia minuta]UBF29163.1 tetratricopeptide repeat protein [Kovacikia minuta CCNUW1]